MSFEVKGWRILLHPLVLERIQEWQARATKGDVRSHKLLAGLNQLMFEVIPSDPGHPRLYVGHSLGSAFAHWRRAKMYQRYRVFFRFSSAHRSIVLVWINDERSLRAYGAATDAYATFQRMIERGTPPDDLDQLLWESEHDREK